MPDDILAAGPPGALVQGMLHVYVAFDWGDEVDLQRARPLIAASYQALPRRKRTPSSFSYRPPPLHVHLEPANLDLPELGKVTASAGATIFDFAAVSVALRIPFQMPAAALVRLAGALAESGPLVQTARTVLTPLYRQLLPAIRDAAWPEDLSEEYFVFQLAPEYLPLTREPRWVAGLVHLESVPLSGDEVQEATRLRLSYSPDDLFVPDWTAAVLVDRECDETLQAIEFANLQLLEFRHIDNRLDDRLAQAWRVIQPLTHTALPLWRVFGRPLRMVGGLKVEANDLFERAGNVLKLVGDPYLARVYRLVASRFHLETWEASIRRKLEAIEGVYGVVADQARDFRMEFLEIVVVLLILLEVVLALLHSARAM
jgi:hypothetical protein